MTGMTLSNQRLLHETESRPMGYMGMWPGFQKLILLVGLSLKRITRDGEGQGGTHKVDGWGKSMLPVESYLVQEEDLHGDLHGVIAGVGKLVRGRAFRRMPQ